MAERLAAGGAFDPRKDRDAVETYAEEVLVPGLVAAEVENDAFLKQTTDFAARTGVWPRRLRGWMEAQLAAGAPGFAGPAAQALAGIRRARPDAVADLPRGEIAFASAAARLIDQGVAADAALARMRPLRGLPEAADAETRAAEVMELRPRYRDWLDRDAGSDVDAVDAATVGRFAPTFEDWFFRTGDAPLSRDLAFQDLRADVWRADIHAATDHPLPEPIRPDDDKGPASTPEALRMPDELGNPIDPAKGFCPDVYRPGWVCDGAGRWRPKTPDDEKPVPETDTVSEPGRRRDDLDDLRAEARDRADDDGSDDEDAGGDDDDGADDGDGEDRGPDEGDENGDDGEGDERTFADWAREKDWSPEEFADRLDRAIQIRFPNATDGEGADGSDGTQPTVKELAERDGLSEKEASAAQEIADSFAKPVDTSAVDGKTEAEMAEMLEKAGIGMAREIAALGKEAVAGVLEIAGNDVEPGAIVNAFKYVSGLILRAFPPAIDTSPKIPSTRM